MNLDFSPEDAAFREEARTFIAQNYPKELREKQDRGEDLTKEDYLSWHRILAKKGWATPSWPVEFGGTGWTPTQKYIWSEEQARADTLGILPFGVSMLAPVIYTFGTQEQKEKFLPGIRDGLVWWCQGYSEPGAGSDLASLKTKAERVTGDDGKEYYIVNGQKTWTTLGQHADWGFFLVRTDPDAKPQSGISFLLIDMTTPGVEVRPILLINGTSPFCETFFTDVVVPKNQLFGPLNGGWTVAKRLLQFERDNISAGLGGGSIGAPVNALTVKSAAKQYVGLDESGRLADSDLRRRITEHLMEVQSFQQTVRRAADEAKAGNGPSAATSIMKYMGAKVAMDRNELIVEALGTAGAGWGGEGYEDPELAAVRTWLRSKGNSIEGGTSEINLNVVSKRVLGLPDPK